MSGGIKSNDRNVFQLNEKYDMYASTGSFVIPTAKFFLTSEMKAYTAKYADPLSLNFKLMIDFDKPYGLFAEEENINSALAYLKRIGENERHKMLERWIKIFKIFIKDFDFLIQSCDGVSEIVNKKAGDMFTGEEKFTIETRETSDMLCQSLLTTYRHIWYDDIRQVEVIPANLRRFDLNILIYSAGYYNMALYDAIGVDAKGNSFLTEDENYQTKMFPTLKKLSDGFFKENANSYDFNHHLIMLKSVQIDNEESGKSFFENLQNTPDSEEVKNTFVFNYKFASYKGIFNNIFGVVDFVKILAISAAQDKVSNIYADFEKNMTIGGNNTKPYEETFSILETNTKDYLKNVGNNFKKVGTDTLKSLAGKPEKYLNGLIGQNSVIGNALSTITDPSFLPNMVKSTIDAGIDAVEDKYINGTISKINNLVSKNFSDSFTSVYDKYLNPSSQTSNVELIVNTTKTETSTGNGALVSPDMLPSDLEKGIKFEKSNIYTRGGF